MAGKEEAAAVAASKPKVDGEPEVCWRKEVDQNIKRLQSLLFGADAALDKGDFGSAQVLSLGLIGFLDSRSQSSVDEAFIRPIRREAVTRIGTARRALTPDSDRYGSTGTSLVFFNWLAKTNITRSKSSYCSFE